MGTQTDIPQPCVSLALDVRIVSPHQASPLPPPRRVTRPHTLFWVYQLLSDLPNPQEGNSPLP